MAEGRKMKDELVVRTCCIYYSMSVHVFCTRFIVLCISVYDNNESQQKWGKTTAFTIEKSRLEWINTRRQRFSSSSIEYLGKAGYTFIENMS